MGKERFPTQWRRSWRSSSMLRRTATELLVENSRSTRQSSDSGKGDRSTSIKTKGNEKNRFTIMRVCTGDGGKHYWIKTLWGKRTRHSEPSLLVLDAFRCHKTEKTKKLLKEKDNTSDHPRRNDQHISTVYGENGMSGCWTEITATPKRDDAESQISLPHASGS